MRVRRMAIGILLLAGIPLGSHFAVQKASKVDPPKVDLPALSLSRSPGGARAGRSFVRRTGKLLEVFLRGGPAEIGRAHALLLYDDMVETERVVWRLLDDKVPSRLARLVLLDTGQFAYRHVADWMPAARRVELAAAAASFQPDPFEHRFSTFQRFVYLTALYDISLAYERSPLIGCTTFTFSGDAAAGSPLLARAFDFDVDDIFDDRKAVFFVEEDGMIPFASVAWPGLVGVVSGLNRAGVAAVVHGARGGPTRTTGEPVVHELRRLLSTARTTSEAVLVLEKSEPLVSHIVVVADAGGHSVAVERIPGAPPFARELGARSAVTNHLEGPFSNDPKNLRVREISSTLARRARGDELVRGVGNPATAVDAVRLLRDRKGAGDKPLPLGDRKAIDALISTHAVVMETATKRLWVSESPHSLGRFVAFDLDALFGRGPYDPPPPHDEIPADPLLDSDEYKRLPPRAAR
jgi:isopenicillin-N N-acyltransferase-like protein